MLTEKEKFECKQILDLISDEDIFALVRTSSNQAVKVYSRSEAENAILSFSESAEELLNRRKVNKGILLKYCLNSSLPASANDSKPELVNAIINNWAQTGKTKSSPLHQNYNESSSASQPAPSFVSSTQKVTVVQNIINVGSMHETRNNIMNISNMTVPNNTDQINSETFVKWFFEMLNACHPAMSRVGENFGPHLFWDNAQLFLLMSASDQKEEHNIVGSDKIAERLVEFTRSSHILFNPNVNSQGVTVKSYSHGAKVVLVCGTLHRATECVGIFQQSFALVSNPLSPGSWKVKVTCLKMDQCPPRTLPRLEECQEIQAIEAHTKLVLEQSLVVSSP